MLGFGFGQRRQHVLVSLLLLIGFAAEPALAAYRPDTMPRNAQIEQDISDGEAAERANQLDVAEGHYKSAEIKLTDMVGANDNQLADVYMLLRGLLRKEGKYTEAVDYGAKLVQLEQRLYGPDHVYVADDTKQLADVQTDAQQFDDARANYTRAAASPARGAVEDYAMTNYRPAVKISRKDLVLSCYDGIAKTYEAENNLKAAVDTYKRAMTQYSKYSHGDKYRAQMQSSLFSRYRNYIAKLNEQAAAADADPNVTEVRRQEYGNQEYPPGVLPPF
jgi:hypothetical protein